MRRSYLWPGGVLAAALAPVFGAAAHAQQGYYGYGGHGMGWHGGWAGMIFGPLMGVLFIAVIVAVVVLIVRWLGGGQGVATPGRGAEGRSPLDILDERFARGEIDKDEFEERRRILRG